MGEMNLTSMMDLTFLLLIAFIITYPTLEQGISVKLPRASAANVNESKSLSLTIAKDGRIYLDKAQISLDGLATALSDAVASDPNTALLLRGDEDLPYGRMVEVLKVAKKSNVVRMALVTEAE